MNLKLYIKMILLFLVTQFSIAQLHGQQQIVSGTVIDNDGKSPLPGVGVTIKGTTVGVITDVKGVYRIHVKSDNTLVFQHLGYETQEILVAAKSTIDVTLKAKTEQINEVVVTVLGMKREEKALGYAVSKVGNESLTTAMSSNWLNGMSGKVAGLNFDQASSGPGGSIRVTLRGESSINMNNSTALFVVDGVPISSGMAAIGGSAYDNTDAPIDYGNGASDINPEDVESVTVLKGPAATALYGSRAANGAIIITTKSGAATKGVGVSFSSSVSIEQAGFWPDFQDEYGPGQSSQQEYSFYTVKADESTTGEAAKRTYSRFTWGPKYDGQMFYQYPSKDFETGKYTKMPFVPRDWYKGFFEAGVTYNNTLSISSNNGKGTSSRVSFTDERNDWIVPNTGYTRQSFAVSFNQRLNRLIDLAAKVNYYRKNSDNLPMTGYSTSSPTYALLWSRNNVDINWYKDEWLNDRHGQSLSLNALSDNPYMMAYEQLNTFDRDRVFGNVSATFNILTDLKLIVRSGMDMNKEFRTQRKPIGSIKSVEGFYREQTVNDFEMNNDFLVTYDKKFVNKFGLTASFGGNNMVRKDMTSVITANQLQADNVYNLQNAKYGHIADSRRTEKSINSLYGLVQFSYNDFLFVDVTGRNDWSSTLAPGNNSYFYPSVSASLILTEALKISKSAPWVNFLKVRGSWANVGNDTAPYQLLNYYQSSDFTSGITYPNTWALYNLKPENIESYEVGLEARLFRNRWTFDVAYYNATTTDQIINAPVDYSTGVSSKYINAGKINNQGIEISSRIQPIRKKNTKWDINLTWSRNRNKVIELAPGVDTWLISSGPRGEVRATVGGTLGDFYGSGYESAPKGSYILNSDGTKTDVSGQTVVDNNGYPVLSSEYYKMGNTQPEWKGGMTHSFSYKNIRLSMSFAAQWGGMAYSLTHAQLASQGKLKNTLYGRYDGLIHPGVVVQGLDPDGNRIYTQNRTVTESIITYYNQYVYSMNNAKNNVFDTSFLKFKEVRLEYSIPKNWIKSTKVLQGASIAVFATNLFCWTNFPQYDPEIATMNGSEIVRGFETAAYPMTRTYGLNIKLQF